MNDNECKMCSSRIADTAYICQACGDRVAKHLAEGGELYNEMQIAIARLVRFGDTTGRRRGEHPSPVDWDKSADRSTVDNTVRAWTLHLILETGRTAPKHIGECLKWLAAPEQMTWLRYRLEAVAALDELEYAAQLVVRSIDRPTGAWYAGPCSADGCTEDLYGRPGATTLRCRGCGTTHDAQARREWLTGQAEDSLATATEIARFASGMRGEQITAAMIRGLAHRGRIVAHGQDRNRRPTYRVGDALTALDTRTAR